MGRPILILSSTTLGKGSLPSRTVKEEISPIESNILDVKLRRLLFVIGSWDETLSFGAMNLKQSDIKSYDTPRALSGSNESHSTSSDVALLSGSMPSITSFELIPHFVKLNAAAITMSGIPCWSFSAELSVSAPVKQSSTYILCNISLVASGNVSSYLLPWAFTVAMARNGLEFTPNVLAFCKLSVLPPSSDLSTGNGVRLDSWMQA